MRLTFPRFASAVSLAAAMCTPAFAQSKPESIPDIVAGLYKKAGPEDAAHVAFQDENGKALTPEQFAAQVQAGRGYGMAKKINVDGLAFRLLSAAQMSDFRSFAHLKAGERFPAFDLKRLDGTAIDLSALAGRYTLVSFYFAGCAPCVREVPSLNAVAQRRSDLNFVALTHDSAEEARDFIRETKLAWPVVPDAAKLIKTVGVKGFPSMALLDRDGKLVDMVVGGGIAEDLPALNSWLDQRAPMAAPAR
ncbi:hypothetical protein GCM10027321_43050 [Massilia terrae]